MKVEPKWKDTLQPLADQYYRLQRDIEEGLRELDDETLATVEKQAAMATTSNCWWATYHVAQMLRDEVRVEIYRRSQQ